MDSLQLEFDLAAILPVLLYIWLGFAVLTHRYFGSVFPLTCIALVHVYSYYQTLPPSPVKLATSILLLVLGAILLALSPIKLLFPVKPHEPVVSIVVLHKPNVATIDIVAVHGLGSNPKTAWVYREPGKKKNSSAPNWLKDFLPESLPNVRIMTFNHDSDWKSNSPEQELSEYSEALLRELNAHRQEESERHRPIIFICHSFGGLIVKRALLIAATRGQSITELVKGVVFLGTPHGGSHMSILGRIISLFSYWVGSRPEHLDILQIGSSTNSQLNADYIKHLDGHKYIQHCDFYEVLPERAFGGRISTGKPVPKDLGTIPGKRCIELNTHHRGLNKFGVITDPNFLKLRDEIERISRVAVKRAVTFKEENLRREIREWLSPAEFGTVNDIHRLEWTEGTCTWIFKKEEYIEWLSTKTSDSSRPCVLYALGNVGCGKSFLAQFLRQHLQSPNSNHDSASIIYFYFDSRQKQGGKNTAIAFFRTIFAQLLGQATGGDPAMEHAVHESYGIAKQIRDRSTTPVCDESLQTELMETLLRNVLPLFPKVRLVIDALDECNHGERDLDLVAEFIRHAAAGESGPAAAGNEDRKYYFDTDLRIFVTGRPHPKIVDFVQEQQRENLSVRIDIQKHVTNEDILLYVAKREKRSKSLKFLHQTIREKLIPQAEGMFLYVRLVLDAVEKERSKTAALETLNNLPNGLDGLYTMTLRTLQKTDKPEVLVQRVGLFHWLLTSDRPLKVEGVDVALQADHLRCKGMMGSPYWPDAEGQIRQDGFPLVEIQPDRSVQLIHFSITEYFKKLSSVHDNDGESLEAFYYDIARANNNVALTCIKYLQVRPHRGDIASVKAIHDKGSGATMADKIAGDNSGTDPSTYDFLSYAVMKWPYHVQRAENELLNHRKAVLEFCRPEYSRSFTAWARDRAQLDSRFRISFHLPAQADAYDTGSPVHFPTPLHVAAYYGLVTLVQWLLEDPVTVPAVYELDGTLGTPLHVACEHGHSAVAGLLLSHPDANRFKDATDINKQTALHRAALKGHSSVVKVLFESNIIVDSQDSLGRTAIFLASLYGRKDIVQQLVEYKCRLDCMSVSGDTALTAAVLNGHGEILTILLEAIKRNTNSGPLEFRSYPMTKAARNGYTNILTQLLDYIPIETTDNVQQTALHAAATSGHEEVATLLLRKGAKIDALDQANRTPLYFACEHGQLRVVQLLLGKTDYVPPVKANVNSLDRRNQTVLFKAAGRGHIAVVHELLASGIHFKAADHWGRTALHWAAGHGQFNVVQCLLDAGSDVEAREWQGETPLHWASKEPQGHLVIKLLLDRGANPASEAPATNPTYDHHNFIPAHWASLNGHLTALQYLAGDPRCDLTTLTSLKQSMIHLAALGGHARVVEYLLGVRIDVNVQDMYSQTALHIAARKGETTIVKLLLQAGCNTGAVDRRQQTALHLAASAGRIAVIDELLQKTPEILTMRDYKDRKASDRAGAKGHAELAAKLQKEEDLEFRGLAQRQPWSKFHEAARTGDVGSLRTLLKGMNKDERRATDATGQTALHWAAMNGHVDAVKLLLKEGEVDPNSTDHLKRTAIHVTLHNSSNAILEILVETGGDVNAVDKWGKTALHLAAFHGQVDAIKELIRLGADGNAQDHEKRRTPMHKAAIAGHEDAVRTLLALKADANVEDFRKQTPLHVAAWNGRHMIIPHLLSAGASPLALDVFNRLPIHLAAASGNHEALAHLLDPDNIESQANSDDEDLKRPIHFATIKGSSTTVNKLLAAGADIRAETTLQQTALHLAAKDGHVDIVQSLLKKASHHDYNMETLDYWRSTPLMWAAKHGHVKVAKLLIGAGHDIMAVGDIQFTALHLATENDHTEMVKLLLSKGAFMDARLYRTQQTPLHLAAKLGFDMIVQALLQAGANPHVFDNQKETALHLAVRARHTGVVEELLAGDADPILKNAKGESAVDIAKQDPDDVIREQILPLLVVS